MPFQTVAALPITAHPAEIGSVFEWASGADAKTDFRKDDLQPVSKAPVLQSPGADPVSIKIKAFGLGRAERGPRRIDRKNRIPKLVGVDFVGMPKDAGSGAF